MYIGLCQINLFYLFRVIHGYIRLEYIERHVNESEEALEEGLGAKE